MMLLLALCAVRYLVARVNVLEAATFACLALYSDAPCFQMLLIVSTRRLKAIPMFAKERARISPAVAPFTSLFPKVSPII